MNKDGEEFEKAWKYFWSIDPGSTIGPKEVFAAGHASAKADAQVLVDALELACNCRRLTAKQETLCFACEALAAYRKEPRP